MNWLLIAVFGHLANAVAFIVDKALLTSALKRSGTYAAIIGSLSFLILILAPWVKTWPGLEVWPAMAAFGGMYVFALWTFYEALKGAETSRVVPVIGSFIPLLTLAGTSFFFHERLTLHEYVGFAFLVLATAMLAAGGSDRAAMNGKTFLMVLLSSVLFAGASVSGKYAFDHGDFFGVLIGSRLVAGTVGLLIAFGSPSVRAELLSLLSSKRKTRVPMTVSALAIGGQLVGSIGFLLVYFAISKGSAAIVNVLQAVQYAGIVLAAWFGGKRLRRLLKEERTMRVMIVKSLAIVFVAIGLGLVATSA